MMVKNDAEYLKNKNCNRKYNMGRYVNYKNTISSHWYASKSIKVVGVSLEYILFSLPPINNCNKGQNKNYFLSKSSKKLTSNYNI